MEHRIRRWRGEEKPIGRVESSRFFGISIHRPSLVVPINQQAPIYYQLWRTNVASSAFNGQGINEWMTIPQVITQLPERKLDEFSLELSARSGYLQKYLGVSDRKSSERILDAASTAVGVR